MLDRRMATVVGKNMNMAVPWYLMASYAYYELDDPMLSDGAFDKLGSTMLKIWDHIEHRHKHLITEDDLRAGGLMNRDWPGIVIGAYWDLAREERLGARKKRKRNART